MLQQLNDSIPSLFGPVITLTLRFEFCLLCSPDFTRPITISMNGHVTGSYMSMDGVIARPDALQIILSGWHVSLMASVSNDLVTS